MRIFVGSIIFRKRTERRTVLSFLLSLSSFHYGRKFLHQVAISITSFQSNICSLLFLTRLSFPHFLSPFRSEAIEGPIDIGTMNIRLTSLTIGSVIVILFATILAHGYKIDVSNSDLNQEADNNAKVALLRALLDQGSKYQGMENGVMDVRPRRVGSMGWGPGGAPMSGATGLYIMCVERSRSMGSNAGQCSSFLAAKKWDSGN